MEQSVIVFSEDRHFLMRVIAILESVKGLYVHCHVESLLELEVVLTQTSRTYLIIDGHSNAVKEQHFLAHWQRFRNQLSGTCLVVKDHANPISNYLFMGIQGLIAAGNIDLALPKSLKKLLKDQCFMDENLLYRFNLEQQEKVHSIDISAMLTEREIQVLRLILKEKSNTVIAKELFISIHTVNSHRKNIFRKLGVKSIIGLLQLVGNNPV